jgi:hypothetical protein
VSRPQDYAVKGPGRIKLIGLSVIGENTRFSLLQQGDKIRPGRSAESYKVSYNGIDTDSDDDDNDDDVDNNDDVMMMRMMMMLMTMMMI